VLTSEPLQAQTLKTNLMKTQIDVEINTKENLAIASKINTDIKNGDIDNIDTILEIAKRHCFGTYLNCGCGGHHVWISRNTIMQTKERQIIIYIKD
jgi:hypothetical protein